ncbi:hypothetical protein [Azotobacter beijerinckii]|nr:hypothetical protein [Azotobacter beijerinckii]
MPKLLLNQREIRKEFAHLTRREDNERLYLEIDSQPDKTDISAEVRHALAPGYRLLRIDERETSLVHENFEIALLNYVTRTVVYYNKVIMAGVVDLDCRPATQLLVWRSADQLHSAVLRDLPKDVFFNYILERYDVILSDDARTGEGHFFWRRQLSTALALKLCVYLYKKMGATLLPIPDQAALDELDEEICGEDAQHEHHLAIISKVELPAGLVAEV